MQRLIREHEVAATFKRARKTGVSAVIAVPFWGKGAVSTLGLRKGPTTRVICNLDSVACNPEVIDDIRNLGIEVRTHPRLHAKIYATESFAIVGSSNASTNGMTVEGAGSKGWIEANIASSDPELVADVIALFDMIWGDGETRKVRTSDIEAARRAREAHPPIIGGLGNKTLFAACRDRPDDFRAVFVAVYDQGLGKGGLRALSAVKKGAAAPAPGLTAGDFRNAWGYQYDDILPGAWLVDLNCKRADKARYTGCARATGLRLRVEGETDLTIALPGMVRLVEGGPGMRVSAAEKASLVKNAARILSKSKGGLVPLRDAIRIMDLSK
jgi:hypothetical protein